MTDPIPSLLEQLETVRSRARRAIIGHLVFDMRRGRDNDNRRIELLVA